MKSWSDGRYLSVLVNVAVFQCAVGQWRTLDRPRSPHSSLANLSNLPVAGMYYIDPNQGSPADALLAYCSFSSSFTQTCLHAQDSQVLPCVVNPPRPQLIHELVPSVSVMLLGLQLVTKAWMEDHPGGESFQWLSRLEQGFQVREGQRLLLKYSHSVPVRKHSGKKY